jgi:hypothetical protein
MSFPFPTFAHLPWSLLLLLRSEPNIDCVTLPTIENATLFTMCIKVTTKFTCGHLDTGEVKCTFPGADKCKSSQSQKTEFRECKLCEYQKKLKELIS